MNTAQTIWASVVVGIVVGFIVCFFVIVPSLPVPDNSLATRYDSLMLVHVSMLSDLDKIKNNRDTITKTLTKIKVVYRTIDNIKPIYNQDSLTLKLNSLCQ